MSSDVRSLNLKDEVIDLPDGLTDKNGEDVDDGHHRSW